MSTIGTKARTIGTPIELPVPKGGVPRDYVISKLREEKFILSEYFASLLPEPSVMLPPVELSIVHPVDLYPEFVYGHKRQAPTPTRREFVAKVLEHGFHPCLIRDVLLLAAYQPALWRTKNWWVYTVNHPFSLRNETYNGTIVGVDGVGRHLNAMCTSDDYRVSMHSSYVFSRLDP